MIEKTSNGRFRAVVYVWKNSKRVRATKRFNTRKEAKAWEADVIARRIEPTSNPVYRSIPEVVDAFRVARYHKLRPKSVAKYEQLLRDFLGWCEQHGIRHVRLFGQEQATKYEKHVQQTRKGKGAVVALQTIKSVFRHELTRPDRAIERSPFEHVIIREPVRKHASYLSPSDERLLFAEFNPKQRAAFTLMLNTGLRRDELRYLRWFNVQGDFLRIESSAEFTTKSGRSRKIPLNEQALESLATLRRMRTNDYVYPGTANQPTAINSLLVQLHRASLRASESSGRDLGWVTLHTLRRTFATRLLFAGVSIGVISRLLGHATIQTTELYFGDLAEDDASWAVAKLTPGVTPRETKNGASE